MLRHSELTSVSLLLRYPLGPHDQPAADAVLEDERRVPLVKGSRVNRLEQSFAYRSAEKREKQREATDETHNQKA